MTIIKKLEREARRLNGYTMDITHGMTIAVFGTGIVYVADFGDCFYTFDIPELYEMLAPHGDVMMLFKDLAISTNYVGHPDYIELRLGLSEFVAEKQLQTINDDGVKL